MTHFSLSGRKVWVAGHRGMVGSALVRRLATEDCAVLEVARKDLNLTDPLAVNRWMERERPDVVFLAAAKVGGILANNSYPGDFLYENLMIQTNVLEASRRTEVKKLVFLGSSCIYPKFAEQPIREESLLTGPLEPTNQWYAVAKIAGLKLVEAYRIQHGMDFISAMPTNLYGPGDNFDLATSHVVPALIRKIHVAKTEQQAEVVIWGTGSPRREFLHADDCADACVYLAKNYSDAGHINVGYGSDISIHELASTLADIIGYRGALVFDTSKPDGTPRKLLDNSRIRKLGWNPRIPLRQGLKSTYEYYLGQSV